MKIGFDVISDLNLKPNELLSWEGKATSLYCIIAGNISNDLRTIHQILLHLSHFYQGVFYTAGTLEYEGVANISTRTNELFNLCKSIKWMGNFQLIQFYNYSNYYESSCKIYHTTN